MSVYNFKKIAVVPTAKVSEYRLGLLHLNLIAYGFTYK